jgi:alpha-galactosidase
MLDNGMHAAGYRYLNLDDCWASWERPNGTITWDPARFPSGIPALTRWLHERNLRFGLYTSAGMTTCSSGTRAHKIPGSLHHFEADAQAFADWNVDYVKIGTRHRVIYHYSDARMHCCSDVFAAVICHQHAIIPLCWLHTVADWCGDKEGHTAQELHTNFSHALNATGRSMHLELCRGYPYPPDTPAYVAQVANSWRIARDHHDEWADADEHSSPHAIDSFIGNSRIAGPYNWGYGDFLMTGGQGCAGEQPKTLGAKGGHCPGQTDNEYKAVFSIYCVVGSPLIVATDITNLTQVMKEKLLNTELIAVDQVRLYAVVRTSAY